MVELWVKAAPTARLAVMVTVHVWLVPEQAPVHPVKFEPVAGAAVRVTDVPEAKVVPVGFVETEPLPVPDSVTVRV